jgi:dTDP-4-dehydrorhamnose reductase
VENVIITGGSGLLALNWAFFKKNDTQITLLLHKRKVSIGGVNSIFINLESEIAMYEFLSKKQQCIVIHCAAITNVDYCEKNSNAAFETNVLISKKLAKVCYKLDIKFVHISSDHLFSGLNLFSTEQSEISPLNVYGASKAKAEEVVLKNNPESLIIRTNFFGWGTSYRASFSDFLIIALRENKKISLFTDIFYTPIYAKNLIKFVHMLINSNYKGVFNIVGSERVSKYEFGKMIFNNFSGNMNLITKVQYEGQVNSIQRPSDMSLSNNKLLITLNTKIEKLEDQIQDLKSDENAFKESINNL